MARVYLYVQDNTSRRFLQSANTVEELKVSKNTIVRWSNEMGHPYPEKGAQLLIEASGVISEATFSGNRIRWKDTELMEIHKCCIASRNRESKKASIFGG